MVGKRKYQRPAFNRVCRKCNKTFNATGKHCTLCDNCNKSLNKINQKIIK